MKYLISFHQKKILRKHRRRFLLFLGGLVLAIAVAFNLVGSFIHDPKEITRYQFMHSMLTNDDVASFVILYDENLVKVTIKDDRLFKPFYLSLLSDRAELITSNYSGPHFQFFISAGEEFEKELRVFYGNRPHLERVSSIVQVGKSSSPFLNRVVLPVLVLTMIFIGLLLISGIRGTTRKPERSQYISSMATKAE
jgi:hypothetical protein